MVNSAPLRPRFLAPGDKLGKFDLIRQIAVGGMAEIYLARTLGIEGFEKLVVVKRILPQYADNPTFVSMFLNEARLAATLHHPNITQVYDIGVEGGEYFFSMEYVHGEDLGRLSVTASENGVPMSLDAALTLVAGLCAGLHYAHEKAGPEGKALRVVHRDVSPSNVLVSYDGAVKLVDFGIARAGSQPSQTRGGLKGKIAYMSPEQCKGKVTLDRRSDLFSVGTILYELTTGQLPFTDETEYGVLSQIVNTDAQPPSKLVPSYPPALEAIVMRALARDPARRYSTALELQGHVEDFAHENRLRVSPLVLARLMSTLFPARLEEWDHARAQGAFFVEQHVLRTLIESGKTSDNAGMAAVAAAANTQPTVSPPSDEDTTAVTHTPVPRAADTSVGPPPVRPSSPSMRPASQSPFAADTPSVSTLPGTPAVMPPPMIARVPGLLGRTPTPLPRAPTPMPDRTPAPPPPRQATPFPPQRAISPVPGEVPILQPHPALPLAAGGGTLVSNLSTPDNVPVAVSQVGDVTERVRLPTPRADTTRVGAAKRRSRLPLIAALAGAVGAVIGVYLMLSGATTTAAKTEPATKPATEPKAADQDQPIAANVKPDPVAPQADPVKVDEPAKAATAEPMHEPAKPFAKAEPAKVDPARRVKPAGKVKPRAPVVKSKPPEPKVVEPKAKPPEPKDPSWNADSPFMPVRTETH